MREELFGNSLHRTVKFLVADSLGRVYAWFSPSRKEQARNWDAVHKLLLETAKILNGHPKSTS